MSLLSTIKNDLRISGEDFDASLLSDIASAKHRLVMMGVNRIEETDPLTINAIKLYCRSAMNFQNAEEKYMEAFVNLGQAMSLSGDYHEN